MHHLFNDSTPPLRLRWKVAAGVVLLATVGGLVAWVMRGNEALPSELTKREVELATRRYRDLYGREPSRLDLLSIAGELAVRSEKLETAVACFRAIPSNHPRYGAPARFQQGQVLLKLNRADEAEEQLREFLSMTTGKSISDEQIVDARKLLNYILSVELRFEDRKQEMIKAHAEDLVDVFDSKQFFFPNLLIWNSASGRRRLSEFVEADPLNWRLRVAQGRYFTVGGDLDQSRALLEELHQQRPDDLPCQSALLECHFERNDWERFTKLAQSLPAQAVDESWLLIRMRGEWALHERRWKDAVQQFERLREVDPANPWCLMGLAKAFGELNRPKDREEMLARSLVLSRIRVSLSNIREDDASASKKLAEECRKIGLDEAAKVFDGHAERIQRSPKVEGRTDVGINQ